jgi:hypothetical protein
LWGFFSFSHCEQGSLPHGTFPLPTCPAQDSLWLSTVRSWPPQSRLWLAPEPDLSLMAEKPHYPIGKPESAEDGTVRHYLFPSSIQSMQVSFAYLACSGLPFMSIAFYLWMRAAWRMICLVCSASQPRPVLWIGQMKYILHPPECQFNREQYSLNPETKASKWLL